MVASSSGVAPSSARPPLVALVDLRRVGGESSGPPGRRTRIIPPRASVVSLPDPCTDEGRQYLLLREDRSGGETGGGGGAASIYELNSMTGADRRGRYGSFLVGSRVVSDGSLCVGTRVDPLYFVLASCVRRESDRSRESADGEQEEEERGRKRRWQPLEQALDELRVPGPVRRALRDPRGGGGGGDSSDEYPQLRNLFESTDRFGGDLVLRRFSEDRALRWLAAKHSQALRAARAGAARAEAREGEARRYRDASCGGTGAFSSGFVARVDEEEEGRVTPEDEGEDGADAAAAAALTEEEERRAEAAALHLVCGYVPEGWRAKLAGALGMKEEDLLGERERRRRRAAAAQHRGRGSEDAEEEKAKEGQGKRKAADAAATTAENRETESDRLMRYAMGADGAGGGGGGGDAAAQNEVTRKRIKLGEAKSAGLKRLAKVNTKGMKSLASFFKGGGGGAEKSKMTNKAQ